MQEDLDCLSRGIAAVIEPKQEYFCQVSYVEVTNAQYTLQIY